MPRKKKNAVTREEEGEEAMEVTGTEASGEAGEGARVLVQSPCRTCHTPTFSSAGASRCFPELSYAILASRDTMTPKAAAGSYRRYDFTIAAKLLWRVLVFAASVRFKGLSLTV
jgi:hypothetical protein